MRLFCGGNADFDGAELFVYNALIIKISLLCHHAAGITPHSFSASVFSVCRICFWKSVMHIHVLLYLRLLLFQELIRQNCPFRQQPLGKA